MTGRHYPRRGRIEAANVVWHRWNEYRSWRPRVMANQTDFIQVSWAWFTVTVAFAWPETEVASDHDGFYVKGPAKR